MSRWGGLSQRKLYATCVGVIFPVCLVSAAVYLFRGELSLLAALPYLAGGLVGGWIGGKLYGRVSVKWLKWLFAGFLFYAAVQAEKLTEGTKNAPYAPGRSACRAVITTRLMMAVTVSEKPASLALPVSESVNLVEKIVIGAKEPSTMISRILMSTCRPRRDAGTVPCRQAAAWS